MRADERGLVTARSAALELTLQSFDDESRNGLKASIGAMLGGFRSMRQQGEDVDAVVTITLAVLRDFPAWAITAACLKIARHETRNDPRFAPNDSEIAEAVRAIVRPYREAYDATVALLGAIVQAEKIQTRSSTRENIPTVHIGDGKHAQRVAAELAARKAINQTSSGT